MRPLSLAFTGVLIALAAACGNNPATIPSPQATADIEATLQARLEAAANQTATAVAQPAQPSPTATSLPAEPSTPTPQIEPTTAPAPTPTPPPPTPTATPQPVPTATVAAVPTRSPSQIIAQARPSVVQIETDLGTGSGVIISPDGEVLTANHVIENASQVTVILADGTRLPAQVLGRHLADAALLKVEPTGLPALPPGDSNLLEAGDTLIKMGYARGVGGQAAATVGIASAFWVEPRSEAQLIQTDAALNEGDSGGPLINSKGEIVGLVRHKPIASGVEGIAFGLMSSQVRTRLTRCARGNWCALPPLPPSVETFITTSPSDTTSGSRRAQGGRGTQVPAATCSSTTAWAGSSTA